MKKLNVTIILTEDELAMLDYLVAEENENLAAYRSQGLEWAAKCPDYTRNSYLYVALRGKFLEETRGMRNAKQTPAEA